MKTLCKFNMFEEGTDVCTRTPRHTELNIQCACHRARHHADRGQTCQRWSEGKRSCAAHPDTTHAQRNVVLAQPRCRHLGL